jgi:tetratricopeptide (TPR) repeat protein/TolB-like protein
MTERADENPAAPAGQPAAAGSDRRWELIEQLFDAALDQPATTRRRWLETATSDADLRAIVARMLDAHAQEGGLLDQQLVVPPDLALQRRLEELLGDRYTIEREIGRGGMATVFLARERKHDRPVVIKALNPEASVAFGSRRFLDEIRVVARLAHPHILPLLDSGATSLSSRFSAETAAAEAKGAPGTEYLYYVMPYLGGDTLRTRLRQDGALPVVVVRKLLADIAAALAAAHGAGIIHRDLKPENILLVGDHAYLLDFGIALLRHSGRMDRHTGEGIAIGTVGYMAPEQSYGGDTTPAADVYAWGVLAREMLTGRSPDPFKDFVSGDLPADTPPGLVRLIEEALAERPAARPRDGAALLERLESLGEAEPEPVRRRWPLALTALLLLGAAGWLVARARTPALDPAALAQPVAVLGFRNETGDSSLATWGRMAGDWITQGLQESGVVQVVPWSAAQAAERTAGGGDPVQALHKETGAGTVITGTYYLTGDRLRFQAQVIDAVRATVLAAPAPALAPRDSADQAVQLLRTRIMAALAIRADKELGGIPGLAERPPTFEAYRMFERGMRAHLDGRYDSAAVAFRQAFALDTTFGVAVIHAATDLWNIGEYGTVDSLLRDLRRRGTPLAGYHELIGDYLRALLQGDGIRALSIIRQAAREAPHDRGRYAVAWVALAVNRPWEARAALASLDPERGLMRAWAPYWNKRVHAEHLVGEHASELALARAMQAHHPDSRAALVLQVRAAAALGREGLVDTLLEASAALPPDTYWSYGAALVVAGEEFAAHGRAFRSNALFKRAVTWLANQLARDPGNRAHRYWLGSALYDAGRWPEAEPYFTSLVADAPSRLDYRGLLALCQARAGRQAEAERTLGPRPSYNPGEHTIMRARLAAVLGRNDEALSLLTQAVTEGYDAWPWFHAVALRDFSVLTDDPRYRRLLAADRPTP